MSKTKILEDQIVEQLEELHPEFYRWALYCAKFNEVDAQEVLQNAYVKFLKSIDSFDSSRNLKVYFFSIIKNSTYDYYKKANRISGHEHNYENEALFYQSASQELNLQKLKDQARIKEVLTSLSKRESEVINLVIYQGLTVAEAAEVMGVTQGSASSYYKRGKEKFKHEIIRSHYADKTNPPDFEHSLTLGLELYKVRHKKKSA